jgi:hypothetical protein
MLFEDESMIRDYQALQYTWFLKGKQRIIKTTGKHRVSSCWQRSIMEQAISCGRKMSSIMPRRFTIVAESLR